MLYPHDFLLIIKTILRKECNYLYTPIICAFYYTKNYMYISLSSLFCVHKHECVCIYKSMYMCVHVCVSRSICGDHRVTYVSSMHALRNTGHKICLFALHYSVLLFFPPFIFTRQFSNFISLYFQTGSC